MSTIAPLFQLITCRKGQSFVDVQQRHHGAMEHKVDLVDQSGMASVLILWKGVNAFKAMMAAGEFQDKQRILQRRIDTDRQFDVVVEPTREAFETSGKSVSDTKAVLVVNGRITSGSSPTGHFKAALSEEGAAAAMGQTYGSIPGVISNLFLQGSQGREAKLIGGAYLFESQESLEAYLASDLWAKVLAETPWEDVKIEQYTVVSDVPAAA
jgi:hypothetical protein